MLDEPDSKKSDTAAENVDAQTFIFVVPDPAAMLARLAAADEEFAVSQSQKDKDDAEEVQSVSTEYSVAVSLASKLFDPGDLPVGDDVPALPEWWTQPIVFDNPQAQQYLQDPEGTLKAHHREKARDQASTNFYGGLLPLSKNYYADLAAQSQQQTGMTPAAS